MNQSAKATLASSLLGTLAVPSRVHADAQSDVLKVGLIGAGGRGTAAAAEALRADPRTELVAIGDVFADRAASALKNLQRQPAFADRLKVSKDQLFSDFDNYRDVIELADVVILATPPHFRPQHLEHAIERGRHCFVEKPIAVDAPGVQRVHAACERAREKRLAVVSGLCWRYHPGVVETISRIKDGAIGEIISIESCYNAGTLWHRGDHPDWSRMEYQIRNWLYHCWLSGDHIVEQAIHSLDKTAWLNDDACPRRATGMGGRQQRTDPKFGDIFDHHCAFFEYESGVRVYFTCRQQAGCSNFVDEVVLGSKGRALILAHRIEGQHGAWSYEKNVPSMYQLEHDAMFKSIREGHPINNGHYMCNSTMIAIMGRMVNYTGQTLTWDECTGSKQVLGPSEYSWIDIPEGEVPVPGKTQFV